MGKHLFGPNFFIQNLLDQTILGINFSKTKELQPQLQLHWGLTKFNLT